MHGHLCVHYISNIASKIRGAVAGIPFESFHKYSSEIIRAGVFGRDEHGKMRDRLVFSANNLVSQHVIYHTYCRFACMSPATEPSSMCKPLPDSATGECFSQCMCFLLLHRLLAHNVMCTQWLIGLAHKACIHGCTLVYSSSAKCLHTHVHVPVYIQ